MWSVTKCLYTRTVYILRALQQVFPFIEWLFFRPSIKSILRIYYLLQYSFETFHFPLPFKVVLYEELRATLTSSGVKGYDTSTTATFGVQTATVPVPVDAIITEAHFSRLPGYECRKLYLISRRLHRPSSSQLPKHKIRPKSILATHRRYTNN